MCDVFATPPETKDCVCVLEEQLKIHEEDGREAKGV